MGIGINNSDSAFNAGIKAGTTVGTLAGAGALAKAVAPHAKDAYNASILSQTNALDKFLSSGLSADAYIQQQTRKITGTVSPASVAKTIADWKKQGVDESQIINRINNMDKFAQSVSGIGTEKAIKNLEAQKTLFETGEVSKSQAIKDTALSIANKVKTKAIDLKDGVQGALKTEGSKLDKLKAVGTSIKDFINANPSIKKAGKFALIAGGAAAVIGLISKAISNHAKADKK